MSPRAGCRWGPAAVRAQLAPTGTLRAGLNFSNFLLTARDAAGTPSGVAVDLARELGRRLEVPVSFVGYERLACSPTRRRPASGTSPFLGPSRRVPSRSCFPPPMSRSRPPIWCRPVRPSAASRRWTGRGCASRSPARAPTTCISPAP